MLALAVVVGPALGCAVPCVDDGFLGMQHDAACKASNTDATTSSTSGATTTSGAASTSGATSETTTTNDTTANDTSTGTSEATTATATSTTDGAVCGDGVVEPGEQCDDGAGNGDDKACKLDCSAQVCGDGALGPGEGCDDGNLQGGDGCNAVCVLESCGDGQPDGGEACDDGQNGDPDDGCTDLCTLPVCGDGLLQPSIGEGCDDGVDNGDDKACKLDCSLQVCGDGALGPGEGCDDGNVQDGDGCNSVCVLESCGDAKLDVGEACDDGQDGDQDDGCTDLCTLPICGDGFTQASLGETCDDGPDNGDDKACKLDCSLQVCGDGALGPGEGCDDGNLQDGDGCNASCVLESCGDNKVDVGEGCDDGQNGDQDDGCTDLCTLPACGDGFVQASEGEACDDGANNKDDGACTLACQAAVCGDGLVHVGVEACDDGNMVQTDACLNTCADAKCGDSVVQAGVEACDDGNVIDGDGCPATCLVEFRVAHGGNHTCALLPSGAVHCWGLGSKGQLGVGNTLTLGDGANELPTPAANFGGLVVGIAIASNSTCALLADGAVRCVGDNSQGELGINSVVVIGDVMGELPPANTAVGKPAKALFGTSGTFCIITVDDGLRCWGDNSDGQLGLGNMGSLGDQPGELPKADVPVGFVPVQVAQGNNFTCARSAAGKVRCWGQNSEGQLGYGNAIVLGDNPGELPTADVNIGGTAIDISSGVHHTCAVLDGGAVRCWGRGTKGQLGIGSTATIGDGPGEMPPASVNLGGLATRVSCANDHSCALLDDGKVRCWGENNVGQLGLGNTTTIGDGPGEMPPADAKLGGDALALFGGTNSDSHCALLAGQQLRCWGVNASGQLGLGNTTTIGDNELPSSAPFVPYK